MKRTKYTQTCTRCKEVKWDDEFHWRSKASNTRQSHCKECQKKAHSKWYQEHKKDRIKKVSEYRERYADELSAKIYEFKLDKQCADCGNVFDPVAMDFDHLRDKEFNISHATRLGKSWEAVEKEITKCELVCANCHRIRTSERKQN